MIQAVYNPEEKSEFLFKHKLKDYFDKLASFNSTKSLEKSLVYKAVQNEINKIIHGIEWGFYSMTDPFKKKSFYRAVAWNVERGMKYEGLLHYLKNHSEISKADVLLLTETDIGMARTENRNIARDFAKELGMNYFFSPSYLNFCKGNSIENHFEGDNDLALHGNAFLSRYPIENLRAVPLKNCKDKMKGSEKRVGCQKALIADVVFPQKKLTLVVAHLDAHSSQRQRGEQLETILKPLDKNPYPVLLGGDLNTSCYNARKAVFAFFGFWNKVFHGPTNMIKNHHTYPYRKFDKPVFKVFNKYGYDYDQFNEAGEGSLHYRVEDILRSHMIREVVPDWCGKIAENTLRKAGGKLSLKLDWFAAKGVELADSSTGASEPRVIQNLQYKGDIVSDHDPILLDFKL